MLSLSLLTLLFGLALSDYCQKAPFNSYTYCDHTEEISVRVKDLLSRMLISEKISQLGTTADAIGRLDIPKYEWWNEALHGLGHSPGVHFGGNLPNSTSFPQVILTAASFNTDLFRAIGKVISTEARAFANQNQAGLTYFTPNINIFRDPRWGRGQEAPGEDPYLTARYAVEFIRGAQGEDDESKYLKVVATCKHFAAYDLEDYYAVSRHSFDATVTKQDLEETYFPAFKACVQEANVGSIMCSYNSVNGVPSCVDNHFNNKIVREEWGFKGYMVSDCGAIDDVLNKHQYTHSNEDTVRAGLRGGCDLNCGSFYQSNTQNAFLNGNITEDDIDLAVSRLFTYRMRLGMFDPPELQPYMSYTPAQVNTPEHQALALQAARESIVLLKNDHRTLPLHLNVHRKIALIGPNADATDTMEGNYIPTPPYVISPVQGFKDLGIDVSYEQGCDVPCLYMSELQSIGSLKDYDAVIAVVGLDTSQEAESHDRSNLWLPSLQDFMLKDVKKYMTADQPLIVVVMSGSSVDLKVSKQVADAILWVGYPGQSGGRAIAEIVYGLVNPSGRLPVTFYPADYLHILPFTDMSMRALPGRTYRFYTDTPVFPFGYGLSYTTFRVNWTNVYMPAVRINASALNTMRYEVNVTNTGKVSGSISVLAFISSDVPDAPLKELFGFKKIHDLSPGQVRPVAIEAEPKVFTTVDVQGLRKVRAGKYKITIEDLTHEIILVE